MLADRGTRAVGLGGVLQVAALEESSVSNGKSSRWFRAHEIPGAGTVGVRALVASELVDQHAGIAVVVPRAAAGRTAAWSGRGAVGLEDVLEGASLRVGSKEPSAIKVRMLMWLVAADNGPDLILPGAGTVRIRALVSGEDVDQYTGVAIEIELVQGTSLAFVWLCTPRGSWHSGM